MADHEVIEDISLKSVLGGFISSYAERDTSMAFSNWLAGRLLQEMPDMQKETSEKLADEIIEAVAAYDRTLDELNAAVDAGQSKEGWFAERLSEAYAGMQPDAAGERLEQIEYSIAASNMQLMQEIGETQTDMEVDEAGTADAEDVEWNKYSLKNKAYEIGEQASLIGTAVAANVVRDRVKDGETEENSGIGDIVKETLQDGLKKNPSEVKAVVAGAVKVAAEKGLDDMLPEDTPMETIGAVAGAAVESAEALADVANGKSTILDATEKIARAGITVACHLAGNVIKKGVSKIPVVGPLVANVSGVLVDHAASKFSDHVCEGIRSVATTAKKAVKGVFRKIGKALFS